jgi:hypothetical protein
MYPFILLIGYLVSKRILKLEFSDKRIGILILVCWLFSYFVFTWLNIYIPLYYLIGWDELDYAYHLGELMISTFVVFIVSLIVYGIIYKLKTKE